MFTKTISYRIQFSFVPCFLNDNVMMKYNIYFSIVMNNLMNLAYVRYNINKSSLTISVHIIIIMREFVLIILTKHSRYD